MCIYLTLLCALYRNLQYFMTSRVTYLLCNKSDCVCVCMCVSLFWLSHGSLLCVLVLCYALQFGKMAHKRIHYYLIMPKKSCRLKQDVRRTIITTTLNDWGAGGIKKWESNDELINKSFTTQIRWLSMAVLDDKTKSVILLSRSCMELRPVASIRCGVWPLLHISNLTLPSQKKSDTNFLRS